MPKKSTTRASKAPAAIITAHATASKLPTVVLDPGIISSSIPISLSTALMAARLKSASNETTKCTIIRARGNASLAHTISRKKCFRPSRGSPAGSGAGTVITKLLSRLHRHSPDSRRVRGQDRPFQRLEQWATEPRRAREASKAAGCPRCSAQPGYTDCIKAHLRCHRLPHLMPLAPHAGAGGAWSRAISDRMSANICRDTATPAIWNVT